MIFIVDVSELPHNASDDVNSRIMTEETHLFRPHTALYFPYMGLPQQEHTQTGRAYTAAYGIWELSFKQHTVIKQACLI